MDDHITISDIGLIKKDIAVLNSILKLSPNLSNKFIIIESSLYIDADLLFVNADDDESLNTWYELKSQKSTATPIMIISREDVIDNEVTIRRPLIIHRVIRALTNVTHQQSVYTSNKDDVAHKNKKILIVDDSFSVRKYMEQKLPALHPDYMMMDFADSGKEAIEKVKTTAYNIVFLDVVMPGVDGYKVCKWIKSVRPKTKIVMLTSKKSPFDKVRGSMSGCDAYLTKPPNDDKLLKILNA